MVRKALLAAALVAVSFTTPASAEIIFDNTPNAFPNGITQSGLPQFGVQVNAAGTARLVTELDIAYVSPNAPSTANLQAFIYANNGFGGVPGTLLWSSAVKTGVALTATPSLIAFSVPGILVPDTFTWTTAVTNPSTTNVGFTPARPATTGSWVQTWGGGPGAWSSFSDSFEIEGRVVATTTLAVPEPSTLALAGLGLAAVVAAKRKRAAA